MRIIPLKPLPNQTVTVVLSGQVCQIDVYQQPQGLFVDVYLNNEPVAVGVIGENLNAIIRAPYTGFSGDLAFIDAQGTSDPYYTGLGGRFSLAYLTAEELAT